MTKGEVQFNFVKMRNIVSFHLMVSCTKTTGSFWMKRQANVLNRNIVDNRLFALKIKLKHSLQP